MQQWRARMWNNAWSLHCRQRYFVCGEEDWKQGAPIFFYVGNEADVTLCVSDEIPPCVPCNMGHLPAGMRVGALN